MPVIHLNQVELSRRWRLSPRTLERWRWEGGGPRFLKVGGRVLYRLEDIEAFEAAQLRTGDRPSAAVLLPKHSPVAALSGTLAPGSLGVRASCHAMAPR